MHTSAGLVRSRQRCVSARSKSRLPKMLDGIKLEDHPLRQGPATLGVMLGKSLLMTTSETEVNTGRTPTTLARSVRFSLPTENYCDGICLEVHSFALSRYIFPNASASFARLLPDSSLCAHSKAKNMSQSKLEIGRNKHCHHKSLDVIFKSFRWTISLVCYGSLGWL